MFRPVIVNAQENIQGLIQDVGGLISAMTVATFALALLVFFWGIAIFVYNAGDEKRLADGKRLMFWGIVTLFVAISVWGIVAFLQITFGVGDVTEIETTGDGGFWEGIWGVIFS